MNEISKVYIVCVVLSRLCQQEELNRQYKVICTAVLQIRVRVAQWPLSPILNTNLGLKLRGIEKRGLLLPRLHIHTNTLSNDAIGCE